DSGWMAGVCLAMTGGQTSLSLAGEGAGDEDGQGATGSEIRRIVGRAPGRVILASEEELEAHAERLAAIAKSAGGPSMWQALTEPAAS
ncbi:DNA polymerase III subunit epsilon, partial [Pseudomonas soli]|nr:DNA polymerase III subunit epsilon [Pseudomonas soli]